MCEIAECVKCTSIDLPTIRKDAPNTQFLQVAEV